MKTPARMLQTLLSHEERSRSASLRETAQPLFLRSPIFSDLSSVTLYTISVLKVADKFNPISLQGLPLKSNTHISDKTIYCFPTAVRNHCAPARFLSHSYRSHSFG